MGVAAVSSLFTVVLMGWTGWYYLTVAGRSRAAHQRLLAQGVAAQARLMNAVSAAGTGVQSGVRERNFRLEVEVQPPGSGVVRRTFYAAVAEPQQGWLQPGALLGVRYDPMRPRGTALRHVVDPSGKPVPLGGPPIISGYFRFAGVCALVSALASLVVFALSLAT